ncbi:hypothetical protein [Xanthovirga aplysinae]|uniref:hypothetical protein n=1 Tax=Xanthovirga aplysinae TaxID=2529853 RepID=UPI0012BB659F|nr:hypothetical protein [Xanthovirga aplysinae]MTI33312.1 hypothetical protein [Xanthovirga aplysinae]
MKKPFKETAVGKLLQKKLPQAMKVIGNVLPDKGVLGIVKNLVQHERGLSDEEKKQLRVALKNYELELTRLELEDRVSARQREIEVKRTGMTDWLMIASGATALGSFILIVLAVIFLPMKNSSLFHQLLGMVEGVALTVFAYYFGTSKSAVEKEK